MGLDRIKQRVIPDHFASPQKTTKVGSETVAKLKLERAANNLVSTDRKPLRHVGQSPDLLLSAGLSLGKFVHPLFRAGLGLGKLVHPHFRAGLSLGKLLHLHFRAGLSLGKLVHPLFRASLSSSEPSLAVSKLTDLYFGPGLSLGKLVHPLFRAGLGSSEPSLAVSKLPDLYFGPGLGLGQPGDRSVEPGDICVDRLAENPEILLGDRVPEFLEHRAERLRKRFRGRIAKRRLEIFVDSVRVHRY